MQDSLKHATGVEKWELLEAQAGNEVSALLRSQPKFLSDKDHYFFRHFLLFGIRKNTMNVNFTIGRI